MLERNETNLRLEKNEKQREMETNKSVCCNSTTYHSYFKELLLMVCLFHKTLCMTANVSLKDMHSFSLSLKCVILI